MIKDCSIEARLFFKMIDTADYSKLGKGTHQEQKEAFDTIYDEYFELCNDPVSKDKLKVKAKCEKNALQIKFIESWLDVYMNTPLYMYHRESLCSSLYEATKIKILHTQSREEIESKLNREIGKRKNIISINSVKLKPNNEEKKFDFYALLAGFEKALGKDNIPDDVSLYKVIAYTNQIKEIK